MKWKGKRIAVLLCLLSFLGVLVNEGWRIILLLPRNASPSKAGDHHTRGQTTQVTTTATAHEGSPIGHPWGTPTPGPLPNYIIREPNKCPEGKPPPFLVLLILSTAGEVEARNAIRHTWGDESLAPGLGIIRLFLMGVTEGKLGRLQQKTLESESLRHHDIIQQDFLDTYHNLTLKTLMGMNWVAMHCPRASYVMKTDSDILVNTVYLIYKLLRPELKPKTNYFTGSIHRDPLVIRDNTSKFYMPLEEYPSEMYPDYCSGSGYVFSGDLAKELYRASLSIRILRFEDVYVGVCLDSLGIKPTPQSDGLFNPFGLYYSSFNYNHMVTVHSFNPVELLEYWRKMRQYKMRKMSDAAFWMRAVNRVGQ